MYNNILIPIAFDSEKDVAGAIEIARRISSEGASITFLHVMEQVPAYITEYVPENIMAETRQGARAKLTELLDTVPEAQIVIIDGPTGRGITNWAHNAGVDCVVIPSHQPVLSDILLGSTAAWVVRHAHCAVHVIR